MELSIIWFVLIAVLWIGTADSVWATRVVLTAAGIAAIGAALEAEWNRRMDAYRAAYPELGQEVGALLARNAPANLSELLPSYEVGGKAMATRNASGAESRVSAMLRPSSAARPGSIPPAAPASAGWSARP